MAPHPRFQHEPFMNTIFTSHETSSLSTFTVALSTTTLYRTSTAEPSVQTFTSTAASPTSTVSSTTKLPLPTTTLMVWEFATITVTSEPASTVTELSTSSVFESTVTSTASVDTSTVTSPTLSVETSSSSASKTPVASSLSIDSSTVTPSSLSPDVFFTFQNKVVATSTSLFSLFSTSTTATPLSDYIFSSLSTSISASATPTKIPSSPVLLFTAPSAPSSSSGSTTSSSSSSTATSLPTSSAIPTLFDYDFTPPSRTLSATFLGFPFPAIPTITSDPAPESAIAAYEAAASSSSTAPAAPPPQNKTPAIVAAAAVPIVAFIFLVSIFMLWFKRQAKRRAIKANVDAKLEEANGERDFEYGEDPEQAEEKGKGQAGAGTRVAFEEPRCARRDSTLAAVDGEGGEMIGRLSMGRVRTSEDESLTEARRHYYQRFSKSLSAAPVRS